MLYAAWQTLEYHYGKHHAAYVTKLNAAIAADSSLAGKSVEEIMTTSSGGVFNNAAQVNGCATTTPASGMRDETNASNHL
jgi:superoxide dismutase